MKEKQYEDLHIKYMTAYACFELGDLDEARKEDLDILEKDPEYHRARTLLGYCYLETGSYKKAKENFIEVLNKCPGHVSCKNGLQQANEELISLYKEELKKDPENKGLALELCWCFYQNKSYQVCIDLLKGMSIDKDKENELYYDYCYWIMSSLRMQKIF